MPLRDALVAAAGTSWTRWELPGPSARRSPPASRRPNSPIPASRSHPVTTQRSDRTVAPSVTANDPSLQFLFSRAPVKDHYLKSKRESREPLAGFRLQERHPHHNLDADSLVIP